MGFVNANRVVVTAGIKAALDNDDFGKFVVNCIERYRVCDWGEMDKEDLKANDYAATHGEKVLASYKMPKQLAHDFEENRILIITEWDRSVTTILFPSEY